MTAFQASGVEAVEIGLAKYILWLQSNACRRPRSRSCHGSEHGDTDADAMAAEREVAEELPSQSDTEDNGLFQLIPDAASSGASSLTSFASPANDMVDALCPIPDAEVGCSRQLEDGDVFALPVGDSGGYVQHAYETIGGGSSGSVYVGYLTEGGVTRRIAVKSVRLTTVARPSLATQLLVAARVARYVHHPRVVQCYCMWMSEDATEAATAADHLDSTPESRESGPHATFLQPEECGERWYAGASVNFALEYSPLLSTRQVLASRGRFPEALVRLLLRDMAEALWYLHETVGVVHNDVKPHNILCFLTTDAPESTRGGRGTAWGGLMGADEYWALLERNSAFKLCDFGAVSVMANSKCRSELLGGRCAAESKAGESDLGGLGTAAYMSPEACCGSSTRASNDIWGLGVTAFHLLTGQLPWTELEAQVPELIIHGFRQKRMLQHPSPEPRAVGDAGDVEEQYRTFGPCLDALHTSSLSPHAKHLITWCLSDAPELRPTAKELLAHEFLTSV